jgi:hypothetical protein
MLLDVDQKDVFDEVAIARKRTITIEEYKKTGCCGAGRFPGDADHRHEQRHGTRGIPAASVVLHRPLYGLFRIPADATKERQEKAIPINRPAKAVLDGQIRHPHHDY